MADPEKGSILVVSDDPDVVEEARFGLPGELHALVALDARSVAPHLAGARPRVIVVDLITGNAGGFALGRDLSQDPRLDGIPIIMLLDRDQDTWLAAQAGAAVTLRKPLEPAALSRAITKLLAA